MSLRQLTRAVPRLSSRFSAPVVNRTFTGFTRSTQWAQLAKTGPVYRAAFSTALPRYEQAGNIDHELSAKLESELQLENEASSDTEELPALLQSFFEQNPWELKDIPGSEEVTLTRRFGKENIKVVFSIADITDYEHDPDAYAEDPALYDEDDTTDVQQGGAQSKGAISQGRTQDGNINVSQEDVDRDGLADNERLEPGPEGFPVRLQVTITKDGNQGALYIEATARDGEILTENVHYFPNAQLAEAKTAEKDWQRRSLYTGPPFGNLDEDLQALFDQYAQERGIDTALAVFIPDYMDYKEQKEYIGWLQATKNFVDA